MIARAGKNQWLIALVLGLVVAPLFLTPERAAARGNDDQERVRFYGWVESMPEGFQGIWIIGGQQVKTSPGTEFDQLDGPLMVGGCAKVDIRDGQVHEIDSEPPTDCR
jgi:hypothetical protein